ncbi:MAG: DUF433 domain-containing protein [Planctomycetes bacterium]|nr:DUF433 domain-containing protein [Planctomycetota bacterium]
MLRIAREPLIPRAYVPDRKESRDWRPQGDAGTLQWLSGEAQIGEHLRQASLALRTVVEINARKLGGIPVLKGTRFSVAQILSQIADGDSVSDIAENFELDGEQVSTLLHALAAYLDRPVYR